MGFLIGFVITLGGFCVMSRAFKAVFITALAAFIFYGFTHSENFGNRIITESVLENFYNFIYLVVGVFFLGTTFGVIRHNCSSPETYIARRNSIFKFMAMWGSLYALYAFAGKAIIYHLTGDSGYAFFAMKRFGSIGFLALIVIFFIIKKALRLPEHSE